MPSLPTPPPTTEWCVKSGTDKYCVFDPDTNHGAQLCETSEVCTQVMEHVRVDGNVLLCTDISREANQVGCYPLLKDSCSIDNTSYCFEEVRDVYSVAPKEILCSLNGYGCEVSNRAPLPEPTQIATYHGPNCEIDPGCVGPDYCFDYYKVKLPNLGGVGAIGYEPDLSSCTLAADEDLFLLQTECGDKEYCSSLELGDPEPICVGQRNSLGTQIYLKMPGDTEEKVECYNQPSQNFGDYWCPSDFRASEYPNGYLCEQDTAVCDQGFAGNLENGCNNPYNPNTDTIFQEYQEECVSQYDVVGQPYYDELCCLDSEFNGYQIYQWGIEETHVKIY